MSVGMGLRLYSANFVASVALFCVLHAFVLV